MRWLGIEKVVYTLLEVCERIIGQHIWARVLVNKVLRAGYYWPTMVHDAQEYVKNVIIVKGMEKLQCPNHQVTHIDISMSIFVLGMDILNGLRPRR